MKDLRLVELQEREGQAVGITTAIVLIIVGGAMALTGVFATSVIGDAIPRHSFSAAENTSYETIRGYIFDALEIVGIVLIIIGVVTLIAALRTMGG